MSSRMHIFNNLKTRQSFTALTVAHPPNALEPNPRRGPPPAAPDLVRVLRECQQEVPVELLDIAARANDYVGVGPLPKRYIT